MVNEGRWHTHLQPALSIESNTQFETEINQKFPHDKFLILTTTIFLF